MSNDIVQKLFRAKKKTLSGFPGVKGGERIPVPARRNGGRGSVSLAILKGVVGILEDVVELVEVREHLDGSRSVLTRHRGSRGARASAARFGLGDGTVLSYYAPTGLTYGTTYHLPITFICEAMIDAAEGCALDLVDAWRDMLQVWDELGRFHPSRHAEDPQFVETVLRVCDEVYFWIRYGDAADPRPEVDDRIAEAESLFVEDLPEATRCVDRTGDVTSALTDVSALDGLLDGGPSPDPEPRPRPIASSSDDTDFVGWQFGELMASLQSGYHALLAGPTGTGKTFCTLEVLRVLDRRHVTARGMEGLTDLDFLGAIVPREGGAREWVDGPLARALRVAREEPVTFFLDEITRLPRVHLNVLPGLLNEQSREDLARQGVEVEGEGPFYALELPMLGEVVWAPCANFQVVAAGNFGRQYAVYDLDPAVRRRFGTVLEFDYLPQDQELELVLSRSGIAYPTVAEIMVKTAAETRRLHANGELPGVVDTGSLIVWAEKATSRGVNDADGLIHLAESTWMDQVAGRDHTGAVVEANAAAIADFVRSLV